MESDENHEEITHAMSNSWHRGCPAEGTLKFDSHMMIKSESHLLSLVSVHMHVLCLWVCSKS